MKFSRSELLRVSKRVASVANAKGAPNVASIQLEARAGKLAMAATDLAVWLTTSISGEGSDDWGIAVNAADFVQRVDMIGDDPTLTVQNGQLRMTAGKRAFTLRGLPLSDCPAIAEVTDTGFEVPAGTLRSTLSKVLPAMSEEKSRPHLNSTLIELKDNLLRAVATDGHRLAMATSDIESSATASLVVPEKGINTLRKLLDGADSASLVLGSRAVHFRVGDSLLGIQLVETAFPPYEQVIPKSTAHECTLDRASLLRAVQAVAVGGEQMALSFSAGMLALRAESPDNGEATDEVELEGLADGRYERVGLHPEYVLDALLPQSDELVRVGFSSGLDPVVIRANNYTGVVMPMRI